MLPLAAGGQPTPAEHPYRIELPGKEADTALIQAMIGEAREISGQWPDSAMAVLGFALTRSRQADYHSGTIRALIETGRIHFNTGAYDQSLITFREALYESGKSIEGRKKMPGILDIISTLYQVHGNYEQAADYLYQAAFLAEKLNTSPTRLSYIYNNLGALLFRIGQHEKAMNYLDIAEHTGQTMHDYKLLAGVLLNKAIIAAQQQQWSLSDSLFRETMETARTHNIGEIQHNTYYNIGMAYLQKDEPEQALASFEKAILLNDSTTTYYRNAVMIALGETWYRLGAYGKAETFLLRALHTGRSTRLTNDLLDIHRLLSMVYEAQGDCQHALRYYKTYKQLKDSIASQDVLKHIGQLEVKYQTAQKDKELIHKQLQIAQQKNDLRKKNIWIGGALTGTALLTTLSISLYRNHRRRKNLHNRQIQIMQQEQEILKQQQEIERLTAGIAGEEKERSRIGQELHDGIGGMLTAINMNLTAIRERHQYVPEMQELNSIVGMLQETAAELRKTAHNLMPDILTHYSLPEALHLYCEQIQAGPLEIELQHYGSLETLDKSLALSLYRIMQELIQNVVKHAGATQLEIQIRQHGPVISITVEDNGIGFDNNQTQTGFGLKNLRSRIQALQGHISIESTPGKGTTVYLELNLEDAGSLPTTGGK